MESSSSLGDGFGEDEGVGLGDFGPRLGSLVSVSLGSGDVVGGAVRLAERETGVDRLASGAGVVGLGEDAVGDGVGAPSEVSPKGELVPVGGETADDADPVGVPDADEPDVDGPATGPASGRRSASSV